MAASKSNPLPPDYVRPTLAEFLAASKAHTQAGYLPFVLGHEAELRKHYVAPEAPPEPAAEGEAVVVEAAPASLPLEPGEPWEYVRDARGIITGTRPLPKEETPEPAVPSPETASIPVAPEENGLAASATGVPPLAV